MTHQTFITYIRTTMESIYSKLDSRIRKTSVLTTLCKTYGVGTTQSNEPDNYRSFVIVFSQDGGKTFYPFGTARKDFDYVGKKFLQFDIDCSLIVRLYCQKLMTNDLEITYDKVQRYSSSYSNLFHEVQNEVFGKCMSKTKGTSYIAIKEGTKKAIGTDTAFEYYNSETGELFRLREDYWYRSNDDRMSHSNDKYDDHLRLSVIFNTEWMIDGLVDIAIPYFPHD